MAYVTVTGSNSVWQYDNATVSNTYSDSSGGKLSYCEWY